MNKQCSACGTVVSAEARFCPKCGGSSFVSPQQVYAAPPAANAGGKKKKNGGLITLIVVLALLALAGIGIIAEKTFQAQGYGNSTKEKTEEASSTKEKGTKEAPSTTEKATEDKPVTTVEPSPAPATTGIIGGSQGTVRPLPDSGKVAYNKGSFDGSAYTNDWANLKVNLPQGFVNGSEDQYEIFEDQSADCGFIFLAEDSSVNIILVIDPAAVLNERGYLQATIGNMEDTDYTVRVLQDYTTVTLGGATYGKMEIEVDTGYTKAVQTYYARVWDGKTIAISVTSVGSSAASLFERSAEKLK